MNGIKMGDKCRDIVTGYEGIVTSFTQWATGCDSVGLSRASKEGKPECEHFDLNRIELVKAGAVKFADNENSIVKRAMDAISGAVAPLTEVKRRTGGPHDAPRRESPPSR